MSAFIRTILCALTSRRLYNLLLLFSRTIYNKNKKQIYTKISIKYKTYISIVSQISGNTVIKSKTKGT